MARGMHRHRRFRLDKLAQHKIDTRAAKRPAKRKATARRDARIIAKIRAAAPGAPLSAECQSWLSRKLDKPFARLTPAEIAGTVA